jgi:hypothetical protein
MDWKAILALAVLVAPMAYCQSVDEAEKRKAQVECHRLSGEWTHAWGGRCYLPDAKEG